MNFEILQADALDTCRGLPDESIAALVTDPPYCSGAATEAQRGRAPGQGLRNGSGNFVWFNGDNMTTLGLAWLLRGLAFQACRFLVPGGSAVFFTDWRMVPTLAPAIESAGLRYQSMIVWDKGGVGLGRGFRPQHEIALHFTKGAGVYHSGSGSNVIGAKRIGKARTHPTEKPVGLLREIVRVVAEPGGVVLDPFAGSAATGEAALLEGRRFLGVERDQGYVEAGRARLARVEAPASELDVAS